MNKKVSKILVLNVSIILFTTICILLASSLAIYKGKTNSKAEIQTLGSESVTEEKSLASAKATAAEKNLKILFVGNSKTHQEDIPGKFKKFADAAGYSPTVKTVTIGGESLAGVASRKKSEIQSDKFDIVVMQEASGTVFDYNTYLSGAKAVYDLVKEKNSSAKGYVRALWVLKTSTKEEIQQTYENAEKVASKIGASVIYDGKAFDIAQESKRI